MIPENMDNLSPAVREFDDEYVEVEVSEAQPLLSSADTDAPKTTFSSFSFREWGILVMLALANLFSIVAYSCIAPFYPKEAKTKGLSDFEIGLTFGIFELVIFLGSPIAGKLGILQTCGGIGFSLGPFLGGMLYDLGGFRLPFYSLGMAMFCMAFLSRFLIPVDLDIKQEESKQSTGYIGLLRVPTIWIMLFALFNVAVSTSFINPAMAGHLESFHLSSTVVGLLFLVSGVCYSVTAPLNGLLVDRYKCHLIGMLFAPIAIIISLSLTGPSPFLPLQKSVPLVLVGQIIFGAGLSTLQIPVYRNGLDAAENAGYASGTVTYGLVSGLFEAVYSLGSFIGPIGGGLINQYYGFARTVTVISGFHLCFVVIFSVFYAYKKCRRKGVDNDV
ncbi:unnamed protein product [Cylicocyclus nassatus]|uniref:Major facilitator superfamily (MFS) profile domain-containing protein n=1 Tax=Cylicocyclus nassatus TaxID=53992 RepID=A0AA36H4F0_CYLNA|nr:unnamed protein product [Cylicocyclus nassatus]